MRIRTLTPDDLDAVTAIAAGLPGAPHWPRASYVSALASPPQRTALAAEQDAGQLAGFLFAAVVPPQAELESIAIVPAFQRQGVARLLMAAGFDEARRRGCDHMLLEVRESNLPARRLYQSLGFREAGRRPNYYGDPAEDALLMELAL